MDVKIRPMEADDWSEIVEIFFQGVQSNMATFEYNCPSYEEWDKEHLPYCRLVADAGREVVAWAALKPFSDKEWYNGVAELSIFVDNDHSGTDLGQVLLNALVNEAVQIGIWSLQSSILQENQASIALHESCGFRRVGYRERLGKDRFGVWRSVVIMEYRIQTDKAGGCDCDMVKNTGSCSV